MQDRAEGLLLLENAGADRARRETGEPLTVPIDDCANAELLADHRLERIERERVVEVLLQEHDVERVGDVDLVALCGALHLRAPDARSRRVVTLDRRLREELRFRRRGWSRGTGAERIEIEDEALRRRPLQREDDALRRAVDDDAVRRA